MSLARQRAASTVSVGQAAAMACSSAVFTGMPLLAALAALAPSLSLGQVAQAAAHAVLFSVLTVLDRNRLGDADAAALLEDDLFRCAEPLALRAVLRLALGLARASGGEELLDTTVAGGSCIQRLASLVQRGEARLRLLLGSSAPPGGAASMQELQLGAGAEKRETLDSNDLLLLAECLYFAVQQAIARFLAAR